MPDPSWLVPLYALSRLGLGEPEAAAAAIAELVEAVFGPFDPEKAEWWAAAGTSDLSPKDLRHLLAEAARDDDPLAFVLPFQDAKAMLARRMRWRWSSRRARALGHPTSLDGQTWASLSEIARSEVREALLELAAYEVRKVEHHRPKRHDLDTLLRELALIHAHHTGFLHDHMTVPHSPTSRFIQLADLVLTHLPLDASSQPWVNRNLWTPNALSERWRRIKAHERSGGDEDDGSAEDGSPS